MNFRLEKFLQKKNQVIWKKNEVTVVSQLIFLMVEVIQKAENFFEKSDFSVHRNQAIVVWHKLIAINPPYTNKTK